MTLVVMVSLEREQLDLLDQFKRRTCKATRMSRLTVASWEWQIVDLLWSYE